MYIRIKLQYIKFIFLTSLFLSTVVVPVGRAAAEDKKENDNAPRGGSKKSPSLDDRYDKIDISGFNILVNKSVYLLSGDDGRAALAHLRKKLEETSGLFPKHCGKFLMKVPIWVEWDNSRSDFSRGITSSRGTYYYHLNNNEVSSHLKAGGIELSVVHCLVEPWSTWRDQISPQWLIHEFAHAYHDQVLGRADARIEASYKAAVERKLYDSVDTRIPVNNRSVEVKKARAYAIENKDEYFAELSVAFFGRNWTYPYSRTELQSHDPKGYALMIETWKVDTKPALPLKEEKEWEEHLIIKPYLPLRFNAKCCVCLFGSRRHSR